MRKTFLAGCLSLIAAMPASAVTYYVGPGGSDAASGTSSDAAWKSLAKANAAVLKPGDSLLFARGGVWTGQLNLRASGADGSPIVVSAYGEGDRPALENPDNGGANAINVSGSRVEVSSLHVRKVFMVGINVGVGAEHTVFRDIEASECGLGLYLAGRYALVTRSSFHDLHTMVNTPGGNDDNGAVGVVMANSDIEVSWSAFEKCIGPSYDYVVDGGAVEIWAERDVRNVYVHHNRIRRCCGFFEIGGRGFAVEGVRVAYNEMADCFGAPFVLFNNAGDYAIRQKDFRFEHNTVIVHDCPGEKVWTCVAFMEPSEAGVFSMRGNLFYVANADRVLFDVTAPVVDHNLVFHPGPAWFETNFTASPTDVIGKDPLLADAGSCAVPGNYRPKPGSPARDAGPATDETLDASGAALSGVPDIGAYETGVTTVLRGTRVRGLAYAPARRDALGRLPLRNHAGTWSLPGPR